MKFSSTGMARPCKLTGNDLFIHIIMVVCKNAINDGSDVIHFCHNRLMSHTADKEVYMLIRAFMLNRTKMVYYDRYLSEIWSS